MNRLKPEKARELYRLFAFEHGVRESARLAGVNRGTSIRYHREWMRVRFQLQQAYDELWEGNCERCDEITAPLPEQAVIAMLDAWSNDYEDEKNVTPKSGFHGSFGLVTD